MSGQTKCRLCGAPIAEEHAWHSLSPEGQIRHQVAWGATDAVIWESLGPWLGACTLAEKRAWERLLAELRRNQRRYSEAVAALEAKNVTPSDARVADALGMGEEGDRTLRRWRRQGLIP